MGEGGGEEKRERRGEGGESPPSTGDEKVRCEIRDSGEKKKLDDNG